jgi:hypothetical protein
VPYWQQQQHLQDLLVSAAAHLPQHVRQMSTPILTKLILTLTNQGGKLLQRPDGQPPPDGQSQPTESLLKTCMQEWQQQHRLQKLEPAVAAAVDAALAGCGFPDLAAAAGQVWEFAGRVRHDVMC